MSTPMHGLRDVSVRAAFLLLVFLAVLQAPIAQAASLTGSWRGAYAYTGAQPPVPFNLTLSQNGNALTGRAVEFATFGDGSSPFLSANVSGAVDGANVSFTKTYDGTGGQTHAVTYTGTLAPSGSEMTGVWSLNGASGTWRVILSTGF